MYCIAFGLLFILSKSIGASVSDLEIISNEIFSRFEKSLPMKNDVHVFNAMQALNVTLQRFKEFQSRSGDFESRDAMINGRIGIFIFTRYCGPGARFLNRIPKNDKRTYASIDHCCRLHDECPDYVSRPEDYERYPELERRPQLFSRFVQLYINSIA